ncbi:CLUMA_CG013736, isoform A [Clunio marinus]|uniref:CLUMA_CG013736, isoform A n=1 Tax=Clunio marinus TaxID=568069 RepID=A0A1J1IL36_9DIPT|nr:CLUMA_CG013736, isoform A [Clunio marinus]
MEESNDQMVNGYNTSPSLSISSSLSQSRELAENPQLEPEKKSSREASRILGTVKWFNAKNGYGFITRDDTGEDVFVHFTGISRKNPAHLIKSLGDGEAVEFNILATNVTAPGRRPVRGNPYVSYIPVRRTDSYASGDPGMFSSNRYRRSLDMGNSRIPRWNPNWQRRF